MTLVSELEGYLSETGESKRSLSLRAGLSESAVKTILARPGTRPGHATLLALSAATGRDFSHLEDGKTRTYAELVEDLSARGESRKAQRLLWLCKVAGWQPNIESVSFQKAMDVLENTSPAQVNLKASSFATYKSEAIGVLRDNHSRHRPRGIKDIGGIHKAVYEAAVAADRPQWELGLFGPFLVFLHDNGIALRDIDATVYNAYDQHRGEAKGYSEAKRRKNVRGVAAIIKKLEQLEGFEEFYLSSVGPEYADGRDKYRVDNAVLAPLLKEFDERVAPWALGQVSRDGMTHDDFIAMLDAEAAQQTSPKELDPKKAQLRATKAKRSSSAGKRRRKDASVSVSRKMSERGFLLPKSRWSGATLKRRRGYAISVAKALYVATGVLLETVEQLTDPEYLEDALDFLDETNGNDLRKGYVGSIANCMRKIGRDFVQRSDEEIKELDALVTAFNTSFRGIAPRNKEKLNQFDDVRIQRMIDLSDLIISDVSKQLPKKSKMTFVIPRELCRDIMAAVAHDIQLEKAFRSSNIIEAKLEWISFQGGHVRIIVPAAEIKMRAPDDGDMNVVLGAHSSARLKEYLEKVRRHCLASGDERNPYLFPSQDISGKSKGQPYRGLLRRVVGLVHRHVGVQIHPHLYRHLVGWIWLKDSLDHLPKVQKLLGHKSLQTTIDYYAAVDEALALQDWQSQLEKRRSANVIICNSKKRAAAA